MHNAWNDPGGRTRRIGWDDTFSALARGFLTAIPSSSRSQAEPSPGRPTGGSTKAVSRARHVLAERGHQTNAEALDGFTWHGLRHTFASRLAMAGVDLLTLKELGGGKRWRW